MTAGRSRSLEARRMLTPYSLHPSLEPLPRATLPGLALPMCDRSSGCASSLHRCYTLIDAQESYREMIGLHTCDQRRSRSFLVERFSHFDIEPGFAEKDPLWTPDLQEPQSSIDKRVHIALEELFENRPDATCALHTDLARRCSCAYRHLHHGSWRRADRSQTHHWPSRRQHPDGRHVRSGHQRRPRSSRRPLSAAKRHGASLSTRACARAVNIA